MHRRVVETHSQMSGRNRAPQLLDERVRDLSNQRERHDQVEGDGDPEEPNHAWGGHPGGESNNADRDRDFQGGGPWRSDEWSHDGIDLDRSETADDEVCGNDVEDVQGEERNGERNRRPAQVEKIAMNTIPGCQLPVDHPDAFLRALPGALISQYTIRIGI
jgi:hypothetical protein